MTRDNGKPSRAAKSTTSPARAAPRKAPAKSPRSKSAARSAAGAAKGAPARPAPGELDAAISSALSPAQPPHGTSQHLVVARGGHLVCLVVDGGPGVVPWTGGLDARLPLFLTWLMDAPGLARPDVQLEAVTLHARVGGVELTPVQLSDDERFQGELVRLPTRVELPAGAAGDFEYWFEVRTTSGETLWHSNFGRNFRLPFASSQSASLQLSAMLDASAGLGTPVDLRV
ncbi:MAG: hypothetical protein AMXMBFR34_22550 [Myxococcaceae bacterium]